MTIAGDDRRFTLLDGMILTAAIAAGFAVDRTVLAAIGLDGTVAQRIRLGYHLIVPQLGCLTLALLAIRRRPPRPDLGRLTCHPGFVAMLSVALPVLLYDAVWIARVFSEGGR